ncbi:uncharacterized protein [Miscanthus floridulus]|uniref:uncharacterized protein n=1 Tax=Miscanthus floridulus TaxID=154761 RepID=UPI00345ADD64
MRDHGRETLVRRLQQGLACCAHEKAADTRWKRSPIYRIPPYLCIPFSAPRKSHVACFPWPSDSTSKVSYPLPGTFDELPAPSSPPRCFQDTEKRGRSAYVAHSAAHRLPLPQPRPLPLRPTSLPKLRPLRPRPSVAPASDDAPRWRPPSVPPPPLRRRGLASRSSKALPLPRHRHARRPARTTAARCLFLSPVSDLAARLALFFYSVPWSGHRRRIDPSSCSPCHHRQRRPPPVIHSFIRLLTLRSHSTYVQPHHHVPIPKAAPVISPSPAIICSYFQGCFVCTRVNDRPACSVGWFVSLLIREEVLLAGLCERKILFRLEIYDRLRQATAKRTGSAVSSFATACVLSILFLLTTVHMTLSSFAFVVWSYPCQHSGKAQLFILKDYQ